MEYARLVSMRSVSTLPLQGSLPVHVPLSGGDG